MTGGTAASMVGGVACALIAVLMVAVVASYNRLARLRGQADTADTQIDAQLRRRHELIPHLAETVRAHVPHERAAFDAVLGAHRNALAAERRSSAAGRAAAEDELTRVLGRLLAVAEGYPALRADRTLATLHVELTTIEDRLAYARQASDEAVRSYNAAVRRLPTNVV